MTPQERWLQEKLFVSCITDEGGMSIDVEIIETVTALRCLDFPTSQSCAGHVDRGTSYPWVRIGVLPSECTGVTVDERCDQCHAKNDANAERLEELLEEFYVYRGSPKNDELLDLKWLFHSQVNLHCRGAETLDLLPQEILTPDKRALILGRHRKEMRAFTEFLKHKIGL